MSDNYEISVILADTYNKVNDISAIQTKYSKGLIKQFEVIYTDLLDKPFKIQNNSQFGLYSMYKNLTPCVKIGDYIMIGNTMLNYCIRSNLPYLTAIDENGNFLFIQQLKFGTVYTIGKASDRTLVVNDLNIQDHHIDIEPTQDCLQIRNKDNNIVWVSTNQPFISTDQIFRYGFHEYVKVFITEKLHSTKIIMAELKSSSKTELL